MCSCEGWHSPRWSKCPFSAFGLAPNDCCKLTSECFNALMGANRKLRMVITQITCTLLLLPPLYGPSSALKTDVPLHSTVKIHISGGVLLWRISSTSHRILERWPVLCAFWSSCALHHVVLKIQRLSTDSKTCRFRKTCCHGWNHRKNGWDIFFFHSCYKAFWVSVHACAVSTCAFCV